MLTAPNLGQALIDLLSWHPGYAVISPSLKIRPHHSMGMAHTVKRGNVASSGSPVPTRLLAGLRIAAAAAILSGLVGLTGFARTAELKLYDCCVRLTATGNARAAVTSPRSDVQERGGRRRPRPSSWSPSATTA